MEQYKYWEPDTIIIEAKATGLPLTHELRNIRQGMVRLIVCRKQGGQETFEWLGAHDGYVIYLAQSENIIQCFSCFLKKFSDWTWEQEIRRGVREDPKYITCRRYKRKKAKNGQHVCLYKGANDTYSLVVEGQCPVEFRCKYEPGGTEPNIDSVVDWDLAAMRASQSSWKDEWLTLLFSIPLVLRTVSLLCKNNYFLTR